MVAEFFDSLLEELGRAIETADLAPDQNNSCLLKMPTGVMIQLEVDDTGDNIIIGSDLGEVPVGRYREDVLREALKTNGMPPPRNGTLAFSKDSEHLILFKTLSMKDLTGNKIADALNPLAEKALFWKLALENEEVPLVSIMKTSRRTPGMFGL